MAKVDLYPNAIQTVGPERGDTVLETEYLHALRQPFKTDTEIAHTPELEQQLGNVQSAIAMYAAECGVDLGDRMPPTSRYHIYDTKAQMDAELIKLGVEPSATMSATTNVYGIFTHRERGEFAALRELAHETVHEVSQIKIKTEAMTASDANERTIQIVSHDSGLSHINAKTGEVTLEALNEVFTDMAVTDMIDGGYWAKAGLPVPAEHKIYYSELAIICDEMLEVASHDSGTPPRQLLRTIVGGMFRGDKSVLRHLLTTVEHGAEDDTMSVRRYGRMALRRLVIAPKVSSDPNKYIQLARALRLDAAEERLRDMYAADTVTEIDANELHVFAA